MLSDACEGRIFRHISPRYSLTFSTENCFEGSLHLVMCHNMSPTPEE